MKRIYLIFTYIVAWTVQIFADPSQPGWFDRPTSKIKPQVLNSYEFSRLTKTDKRKYLAAVKEVLIAMSKAQGSKGKNASWPHDSNSEWAALWMYVFGGYAHADGNDNNIVVSRGYLIQTSPTSCNSGTKDGYCILTDRFEDDAPKPTTACANVFGSVSGDRGYCSPLVAINPATGAQACAEARQNFGNRQCRDFEMSYQCNVGVGVGVGVCACDSACNSAIVDLFEQCHKDGVKSYRGWTCSTLRDFYTEQLRLIETECSQAVNAESYATIRKRQPGDGLTPTGQLQNKCNRLLAMAAQVYYAIHDSGETCSPTLTNPALTREFDSFCPRASTPCLVSTSDFTGVNTSRDPAFVAPATSGDPSRPPSNYTLIKGRTPADDILMYTLGDGQRCVQRRGNPANFTPNPNCSMGTWSQALTFTRDQGAPITLNLRHGVSGDGANALGYFDFWYDVGPRGPRRMLSIMQDPRPRDQAIAAERAYLRSSTPRRARTAQEEQGQRYLAHESTPNQGILQQFKFTEEPFGGRPRAVGDCVQNTSGGYSEVYQGRALPSTETTH